MTLATLTAAGCIGLVTGCAVGYMVGIGDRAALESELYHQRHRLYLADKDPEGHLLGRRPSPFRRPPPPRPVS